MTTQMKVPEIGESITEVEIVSWKKHEGDHVEKDEAIAELETDKATVELPAAATGVLSKIVKQEGDVVDVGEVIAEIEDDEDGAAKASPEGEEAAEKEEEEETEEEEAPKKTEAKRKEVVSEKPPKQADDKPKESEKKDSAPQEPPKVDVHPHVTPDAKEALAKYGLRAEDIEATGPGDRLLREDVLRHASEHSAKAEDAEKEPAASPRPPVKETKPASSNGHRETEEPMSRLRRHIATRLVEAQHQAALLTTFNEINMTAVNRLRERYGETFKTRFGVKLGYMPFFVKATIHALNQFPRLNAIIRDDKIVQRHYHDIGIAVSTERGLIVPVIRNADKLTFAEIESTLADLAERGRASHLKLDELEGGTFTITNGGVFGSLLSTPIVNPPQSGVLGMHAIQDRPVAIDGQVVIAPMMYVALTYDHRIIDGRESVLFLKRVKEAIEEPATLLLGL